ncbi:S8 family serine peptidase [Candidatus Kaiserbacteria bacterium]|nr:S8 family serine peptidase [Candidatus Kaiserbacteria bacterium]
MVANDPRVAFVSEDRIVSIAESVRVRGARDDVGAESHRRKPPPPAPPPSPPPSDESPTTEAVKASLQTLPTGINRIDAEFLSNKGAGVNVAVIDTGIQLSHPDLKTNIVGGKNCSTGSSYNDGNGHGTHVAGTIAALDNGVGVVGVAPSAKLWAVRVLNNAGSGSWSSVICGIDFVTSKAPKNGGPITVANLSLGGGGVSDNNCGNSNNDALHKAICRARDAGVTIVVAAGNSGANAAGFVPAAYDDAVITVSALADSNGLSGGGGAATAYGADDTFASFSNWGTPVDIGAPGVSIYSTWLKSGYKSISGTSMASPHAAGAAALYIANNPGALWSDVRDALVAAGEALGAGHTDPSGKHSEAVLQADTL